MENHKLQIAARAARVENGLHPFQRQVRDAIEDRTVRIIRVEAPVGAGKSRVIRDLLEQPSQTGRRVVLTYPTKILMEAQLGSLRSDMKRAGRDLCIWPEPDRVFRPHAINLINYSTDSLLGLLRKQGPEVLKGNRGDLLYKLFDNQEWMGHENAVITTPDVLHLIAERRYKRSSRLKTYLNAGCLFVLDEFHLYHNLANFVPLLDEILNQWNGRLVLLSATPLASAELQQLFTSFPTALIDFAPDSTGDPTVSTHRVFNHPLDLRIECFRTSDLEELLPRLRDLLPVLPHPTVVILDSVHRLQWLKRAIEPLAQRLGLSLQEWSGLWKDRQTLTERTVVLGTSAIEVGIDMDFRSVILEATYWPSAIQRLGRAGRFREATVVLYSRQTFEPYLKGQTSWDRTTFEQQVLKEALRAPSESQIGGEMFRGDSYGFALINTETGQVCFYDQAIFSMFEVGEAIDDWRVLDWPEKQEELEEWRLPPAAREELLLRDRVFSLWGVLRGRLRSKYERLQVCKLIHGDLHVVCDLPYVFAGK